jgi:hypothetical protein
MQRVNGSGTVSGMGVWCYSGQRENKKQGNICMRAQLPHECRSLQAKSVTSPVGQVDAGTLLRLRIASKCQIARKRRERERRLTTCKNYHHLKCAAPWSAIERVGGHSFRRCEYLNESHGHGHGIRAKREAAEQRAESRERLVPATVNMVLLKRDACDCS